MHVAFLSFDTSSMASPGSAIFTFNQVVRANPASSGSGVARLKYYDWGTTVETADWQNSTQWAALTTAGSNSSWPFNATPTTYQISLSSFTGWNNGGTETRLALSLGNPNLLDGWIGASADASGTTNDPSLIASPASAWSIVGVSSVVETTSVGTYTLSEPAGCASGDLLVATIGYHANTTTSLTLPAGWTLVNEQKTANTATNTSAIACGQMAYIVRGGSAPALGWTTPTGISVALGRIVAYRGNDTTAPFPTPLTPTSDAYGITPTNTTYSVVREATTATTAAPATGVIGQTLSTGNYASRQYFLTFNTSAIPTGATSANLTLNYVSGFNGDFIEVCEALSAANMTAGSVLATTPVLGAAQMLSTTGLIVIPLDITSLTRGSAVTLCLFGRKQRLGTAPTSTGSEINTVSSLAAAANLRPSLTYGASTAATTATATTAVSVTGLTTTQDDDLIVALCAGGQDSTWSAFSNVTTPLTASGATDTTTAPSSTAWIERADSLTASGTDVSLAVFDAVRTTTGATGNLTATIALGGGNVVIAGAFKIGAAGPVNKTLPAVAGSHTLSGQAASLEKSRFITAVASSYVLTGTDATLTKGIAPVAYNLPAVAGSYALTGQVASLYRGREVQPFQRLMHFLARYHRWNMVVRSLQILVPTH